MSATDADAITHQVNGRTVTMPVVVRKASTGMATFLVSAGRAQALLDRTGAGEHLEVARTLPGKTPVSIGGIDYLDNDVGTYDELSILLYVRPKGEARGIPWVGSIAGLVRGTVGTYIWDLPVSEEFSRACGVEIWGFPKTVSQLRFEHGTDRSTYRYERDGQHVLTLSVPRGGRRSFPTQDMRTFTVVDGELLATPFSQGGEEFGVRGGSGVTLELGEHAIADDLRSLGLPKRPLVSMWIGAMHGTFGEPEPV